MNTHLISYRAGADNRLQEILATRLENFKAKENIAPNEYAAMSGYALLLAEIARENKKWDDAIKFCQDSKDYCFQANDQTGAQRSLCSMTLMLFEAGRIEEGTKLFQESKDKMRGSLDGIWPPDQLAEIYESMGQLEKAREQNEIALGDDPDSARLRTLDSIAQAGEFWEHEKQSRIDRARIEEQRRESYIQALALLAILVVFASLSAVYLTRYQTLRHSQNHLEILVKQRTAILRDALDSAELASNSKSDFLARANHEMRNPLQSIIGYTELLVDQPDQNHVERSNYLQAILASSEHLMTMASNILDIDQLDYAERKLQYAAIDLAEVKKKTCHMFSAAAKAKNLEFSFFLEGATTVVGDQTCLQQILVNLISNAVKYTESGYVCCKIVSQHENGESQLTINVQDSGPGIAEEFRDQFFEPFPEMLHNDLGKGLGLHITKALVDFLDGSIELQSEVGAGTQFIVNLPFGCHSIPDSTLNSLEIDSPESQPFIPLKILVVDDKHCVRELVQRQVEKLGHAVKIAKNQDEAMEIVSQWKPAILLLDLRMPQVDGFEVHDSIRKLPVSQPIIYAMTGDANESIRQQALNHGFDGFIGKPFQLSCLKQLFLDFAKNVQPA